MTFRSRSPGRQWKTRAAGSSVGAAKAAILLPFVTKWERAMPAIRIAGANIPASTPDTPFQGTFKTSLCTLRLFPTARSP